MDSQSFGGTLYRNLPIELILEIYGYVLPQEIEIVLPIHKNTGPNVAPSLLRVSKQVREDARELLHSKTVLSYNIGLPSAAFRESEYNAPTTSLLHFKNIRVHFTASFKPQAGAFGKFRSICKQTMTPYFGTKTLYSTFRIQFGFDYNWSRYRPFFWCLRSLTGFSKIIVEFHPSTNSEFFGLAQYETFLHNVNKDPSPPSLEEIIGPSTAGELPKNDDGISGKCLVFRPRTHIAKGHELEAEKLRIQVKDHLMEAGSLSMQAKDHQAEADRLKNQRGRNEADKLREHIMELQHCLERDTEKLKELEEKDLERFGNHICHDQQKIGGMEDQQSEQKESDAFNTYLEKWDKGHRMLVV